MIHKQAELHNVEELVRVEGRPGLLMQRVPESVRAGLLEKGREQIRRAALLEIRFGLETGTASITLASFGGVSQVKVFYGDYEVESRQIGETPTTIEIADEGPEPGFQFRSPWSVGVPRPSFGPIWRILVHGHEVHLLGLEGEGLRPPAPHEQPALRYLAYGTSITFGIAASSPEVTYVAQAAWRLGLDALNLGMPGSAHCEQAIAEHIAARDDWDIATLCISVNMLNQGIPADRFADQAAAMIRTIAAAHPGKPLVCIGLFPSFADLGWTWPEREVRSTSGEYRAALRDVVQRCGFPQVKYVNGGELLDDWRGLSHDLLHPAGSGMIQIGERLASVMRPLLPGIPKI